MKTVKQVLDSKGHNIWTICPGDTVFNAIKVMSEKEVGALPVMENGKLIGIITERDYARKMILKGKMSQETPVRQIMETDVLCVQPEQTIEECMVLMTDKRVRHLPVVGGDKVAGIISIGDLVKAVIAEQKLTIEQLEHYISGWPTRWSLCLARSTAIYPCSDGEVEASPDRQPGRDRTANHSRLSRNRH